MGSFAEARVHLSWLPLSQTPSSLSFGLISCFFIYHCTICLSLDFCRSSLSRTLWKSPFLWCRFPFHLLFLLWGSQSFKDTVTISIFTSFNQICRKGFLISIWVLLAPRIWNHCMARPFMLMNAYCSLWNEWISSTSEFFSPSNPTNWVCFHRCWHLHLLVQICTYSISNSACPSRIRQVGLFCLELRITMRKERFLFFIFLLNRMKRTKIGEHSHLQGFPFTKDFSFHKESMFNLQMNIYQSLYLIY